MEGPTLVIALQLSEEQARMWRELLSDLNMNGEALANHAITSLWISVQLQRAAARLK